MTWMKFVSAGVLGGVLLLSGTMTTKAQDASDRKSVV